MQKLKTGIVIFSRPARSGKTTELYQFVIGKKKIGGFLTPDINGCRVLYDIKNGNYEEFELKDSLKPGINIGKFSFSIKAFKKAKELFKQSAEQQLFIVDEVGRLEIFQDSGWEPELTALITRYKDANQNGILLLVVRDYLLEEFIKKNNLINPWIISSINNFEGYSE